MSKYTSFQLFAAGGKIIVGQNYWTQKPVHSSLPWLILDSGEHVKELILVWVNGFVHL